MLGKDKSVGEDWSVAQGQLLQRPAVARPAATLHPPEAISSISSEMTVVGKIVCKGIIKIYGVVEGELSASNAMIADTARIEGDIIAEELNIGGRVKGNIYAVRVKLRDTAVVEGDIYHRSLLIDENASFEGLSRPEDNLPEPRSIIEVSSDLPPERQTPFAINEKGEFKGESTGEELYRPRAGGAHVFLASCIAAIAISALGYFVLRAIDSSWIWRPAESHYVRPTTREASHEGPITQMAPEIVAPKAPATPSLNPRQMQTALRPTTREAPPEAPITQMAPEIVAPKVPITPSLDPEQVQDFRIDDVSSARRADVTRLTSNAIEFSDHTTAGGFDTETSLMPFAAWASSHPTEKKFLGLFPGYVEPVISSDAADGTDKATEKPYTEKLYMYVAQARFVLAKAPAAIDLSRYVTLPFLEKIDPAIKHKLISPVDATAFNDKAGTGNDNPDRKWCTGPATSICIQSTYKLEGKIPMGIMLVNQLREGKKLADHIDFRSELAVLAPSDLDQVGLQELTGLDMPVTGALEQNIFYVNQIMKFGKFFAVLQAHPSDPGKTVVTAFVALAIKATVLDQKRSFENVPVLRNLVPAQVLMGRSSFNFGSSISAGLPKYARNEIKAVATLLQTQ
jgi:cytoskeletal protein CcmA (bactofilin family)